MAMLEFDAARDVVSALGAPTVPAFGLESSLVVAASLAVDRCGMFRMSLYFDVLKSC